MSESIQTIVVVDDDQEIHDLISAFFKPRDFNVLCFFDANVALHESRITGGSWDILLTDYHFPNMLAADFSARLSEILPNLPIILITPLEFAETALHAVEQGAYDFVTKPIHFRQLQASVERGLKFRRLKSNYSELQEIVKFGPGSPNQLIGRSPSFIAALELAKKVANSTASILISGESGTGKEVFAQYIHSNSKRSSGPFTAINCSSIPESLLESELFGHGKGSFTGALDKRIGLFEAAENGTLFLDEIGDLSLTLQAKLLRVLQEKKIKRVGENLYRMINCRIISASHKNLLQEVEDHQFREDLYFRLNVIPITIPPLRDRPEDLMNLAEHFLRKFALANNATAKSFSAEAKDFLVDNKWRGNVRELENTIERAVVLCRETEISLADFLPPISCDLKSRPKGVIVAADELNVFSVRHSEQLPTLELVINKYVSYAVDKNGGAKDKTAKDIGIDRKTLYKRMQHEGAPLTRTPRSSPIVNYTS